MTISEQFKKRYKRNNFFRRIAREEYLTTCDNHIEVLEEKIKLQEEVLQTSYQSGYTQALKDQLDHWIAEKELIVNFV